MLNIKYRRLREEGVRPQRAAREVSRMAGQEVLAAPGNVAAYVRDKGMVPMVKKLNEIDQAYAAKVENMLGGTDNPLYMTSAVPLKDFKPGEGQADTFGERVLLEGGNVAVGAANVASRYALPLGGAALAVKGIGDVVTGNAFGGPADQQEQGQLSLY